MKILLIDDSSFQRSQLKNILKKDNHEIIEASDGEAGLDAIEKQKPDCVICDILMPKKNGFELLKTLHEKGSTVPVIIISSNIQAPAKKICEMHGAKAFLNKPIEKDKVLFEINRVLQQGG